MQLNLPPSPQKRRQPSGFSMMEIIVALGIISILASAVSPLVLKKLESSRVAAAKLGTDTLLGAMQSFYQDTGEYPTRNSRGTVQNMNWLSSNQGNQPPYASGVNWGGTFDRIEHHFITNQNTRYVALTGASLSGWNGPYLKEDLADPWDNQYWINISILWNSTFTGWIISAGPDGTLDTDDASDVTGNDDIGVIYKN